jgi:F0F1-type ATP synthase membrane subunit b/b'
MNFFKDEINHLGSELQATVKQASSELNVIVQQAGEGLQTVVKHASEELGKQRTLTKTDMQELIQFAVHELDASLDMRIKHLHEQTQQTVLRLGLIASGMLLVLILITVACIKWL